MFGIQTREQGQLQAAVQQLVLDGDLVQEGDAASYQGQLFDHMDAVHLQGVLKIIQAQIGSGQIALQYLPGAGAFLADQKRFAES